jgi:hypothetical protein
VTPPSNKQTRKATESAARERAAALKAKHDREDRRRKLMARGGIGLVLVAVIGGIVLIPLLSKGSKTPFALPNVTSAGAATAPPWAAPTNTAAQVALAGLTILPNETLVRHDHVHLDVFIDGKATPVPAYIGIAGGANATGFAPLHTHDASGAIHIEAADANSRFTLGQVFNEWNVLLTPTQIGSLKVGSGKTLSFYLNGKPLTTDPAKLELKEHQEIAIVYGTAAENAKVTVPKTWDFKAAGL